MDTIRYDWQWQWQEYPSIGPPKLPEVPRSFLHVVPVLLPVEVVPGGVPLDPTPHLAPRHALELQVRLSSSFIQVPAGVPVKEKNIAIFAIVSFKYSITYLLFENTFLVMNLAPFWNWLVASASPFSNFHNTISCLLIKTSLNKATTAILVSLVWYLSCLNGDFQLILNILIVIHSEHICLLLGVCLNQVFVISRPRHHSRTW